jgi:protein-disulfide isomerase
MNGETKVFVGILAATAILIGAAAFFFGRPQSTTEQKADMSILIRANSYKESSPSATISLVEFGDYQCHACGAYYPVVKQVLKDFEGKITYVFREFPLPMHPNAPIAAQAAQAAGKQGKYFVMHEVLYTKQAEWSLGTKARDFILQYAKDIGLDVAQFTKDLDSAEIKQRVADDTNDANTLGVNATPTFYLDGVKIENPTSIDAFESLVKAAIEKAPKPTAAASEGAYHTHANIKVIINGKAVDFSQAKYQSEEGKELNPGIHFHDGVGDLFHVHKQGMTLGDLFTSLGMKLTPTCLTDDLKHEYCERDTAPGAFLYMWVNGRENNQYSSYVPQDLDKILIVYDGNGDTVRQGTGDTLIRSYVNSVADTACIYSEKCPERGTPPTENCVGGLGTGCTK